MDVLGKVIAVNEQQETFVGNDGRQLRIFEVTLSVPQVRAGQASGQPYVEGQTITASMFLKPGEACNLAVGDFICAYVAISSKLLADKGRWFNRVNLVRFVNMKDIQWNW